MSLPQFNLYMRARDTSHPRIREQKSIITVFLFPFVYLFVFLSKFLKNIILLKFISIIENHSYIYLSVIWFINFPTYLCVQYSYRIFIRILIITLLFDMECCLLEVFLYDYQAVAHMHLEIKFNKIHYPLSQQRN